MIRRIAVDGFRSLNDFKLKICPGLNVLVGPNGSGKTNIIQLFEFLTRLTERDLLAAVAASGGTSVFFSREQSRKPERIISIVIEGDAEYHDDRVSDVRPQRDDRMRFFAYRYEIEIRLQAEPPSLFIANETLSISNSHDEPLTDEDEVRYEIKLLLPRSSQAGVEPALWIEGALDDRSQAMFRDRFRAEPDWPTAIKRYLVDRQFQFPIVNSRFLGLPIVFEAISNDIATGYNYNILPWNARAADDFAELGGIKADGSGLSATLYHLSQGTVFPQALGISKRARVRPGRSTVRGPAALAKITALAKLANASVEEIQATTDLDTGKFACTLLLEAGGRLLSLPLSAASDGTAKWLALVTALHTGASILAIEEPENFLHPAMQREFIDLARVTVARSRRPRFLFISTHSESVINQCRPEELLITQYIRGRTYAGRVENAKEVANEINATGFGLGYYYLAGAFD